MYLSKNKYGPASVGDNVKVTSTRDISVTMFEKKHYRNYFGGGQWKCSVHNRHNYISTEMFVFPRGQFDVCQETFIEINEVLTTSYDVSVFFFFLFWGTLSVSYVFAKINKYWSCSFGCLNVDFRFYISDWNLHGKIILRIFIRFGVVLGNYIKIVIYFETRGKSLLKSRTIFREILRNRWKSLEIVRNR